MVIRKQIVNNKIRYKTFSDTKGDSFKDNRRVQIEIFLISRLTSNIVNGKSEANRLEKVKKLTSWTKNNHLRAN